MSRLYNVADLKAIKVSTDYSVNKGNDESRDAFFAYDSETITANLAKTITLRRPFSQLNIVATDVAEPRLQRTTSCKGRRYSIQRLYDT
jgi:hypothetical protein